MMNCVIQCCLLLAQHLFRYVSVNDSMARWVSVYLNAFYVYTVCLVCNVVYMFCLSCLLVC
uniref:Uncharacterized protein n=1 Tax=Arundo donax TaxID=35708 RepID=A0A0A9FQ89_ARUDO